ncbi:MAG: hypothetical protein SFX73_06135 [Kofleriaceae bacterium]|nr:hypothetical protein [Kofleriaceae bacterium]
MRLPALVVLVLATTFAACGGAKPAPTTAPTEGSAAPPPTPQPGATPAIGPDQCCCPFADAEGVSFNVMTKADCDAAGTGCVEADRCSS